MIYDSKEEEKSISWVYTDDNLPHDQVGLQLLKDKPTTYSHYLGKSVTCARKWLKCIQVLEGK